MKEKIVENLIWRIFTFIGVIFLVVGCAIGRQIFNYKNKIDTKGTITDIFTYRDTDGDISGKISVLYTVDEQEYESTLNAYSTAFYEGKEIDIYYNEDNPYEIGIKSFDLVFLVFPVIGLIFFIIGGTGLLIKSRKRKLAQKLKENGELIYANYCETERNTNYNVNGKNPYNIICEWNNPADDKKYIFKSENIWFNPQNLIEEKNIKQFPVYIDRTNNRKYVVDIDVLTESIVDLR